MANPEQTGPMTSRGARHRDDNDDGLGWNFVNIVAAAPTTTAVKASPGILHSITLNTPTATGTIVVYNSLAASGAKIASFTSATGQVPFSLVFDVAFSIGLTIVTDVAAQDITVTYI